MSEFESEYEDISDDPGEESNLEFDQRSSRGYETSVEAFQQRSARAFEAKERDENRKEQDLELMLLRKPTRIDRTALCIPKDREPLPTNPLPRWHLLKFDEKVPLVPAPQGTFINFRSEISKPLYILNQYDFDILDPYIHETPTDYSALHDPHLKYFFQTQPKLFKRLIRMGLLTANGQVTCSLTELNNYRLYLGRIHKIQVAAQRKKQDDWNECQKKHIKGVEDSILKEIRLKRSEVQLLRRLKILRENERRIQLLRTKLREHPSNVIGEKRANDLAIAKRIRELKRFHVARRLKALREANQKRIKRIILHIICEEEFSDKLRRYLCVQKFVNREADLKSFAEGKRQYQEQKIRYHRAILRREAIERKCRIENRRMRYNMLAEKQQETARRNALRVKRKIDRELYLMRKYGYHWRNVTLRSHQEHFHQSTWRIRNILQDDNKQLKALTKREGGSFTNLLESLFIGRKQVRVNPLKDADEETVAVVQEIMGELISTTYKDIIESLTECLVDYTIEEAGKRVLDYICREGIDPKDLQKPSIPVRKRNQIQLEPPQRPCSGPCAQFGRGDDWALKCGKMTQELYNLRQDLKKTVKKKLTKKLKRALKTEHGWQKLRDNVSGVESNTDINTAIDTIAGIAMDRASPNPANPKMQSDFQEYATGKITKAVTAGLEPEEKLKKTSDKVAGDISKQKTEKPLNEKDGVEATPRKKPKELKRKPDSQNQMTDEGTSVSDGKTARTSVASGGNISNKTLLDEPLEEEGPDMVTKPDVVSSSKDDAIIYNKEPDKVGPSDSKIPDGPTTPETPKATVSPEVPKKPLDATPITKEMEAIPRKGSEPKLAPTSVTEAPSKKDVIPTRISDSSGSKPTVPKETSAMEVSAPLEELPTAVPVTLVGGAPTVAEVIPQIAKVDTTPVEAPPQPAKAEPTLGKILPTSVEAPPQPAKADAIPTEVPPSSVDAPPQPAKVDTTPAEIPPVLPEVPIEKRDSTPKVADTTGESVPIRKTSTKKSIAEEPPTKKRDSTPKVSKRDSAAGVPTRKESKKKASAEAIQTQQKSPEILAEPIKPGDEAPAGSSDTPQFVPESQAPLVESSEAPIPPTVLEVPVKNADTGETKASSDSPVETVVRPEEKESTPPTVSDKQPIPGEQEPTPPSVYDKKLEVASPVVSETESPAKKDDSLEAPTEEKRSPEAQTASEQQPVPEQPSIGEAQPTAEVQKVASPVVTSVEPLSEAESGTPQAESVTAEPLVVKSPMKEQISPDATEPPVAGTSEDVPAPKKLSEIPQDQVSSEPSEVGEVSEVSETPTEQATEEAKPEVVSASPAESAPAQGLPTTRDSIPASTVEGPQEEVAVEAGAEPPATISEVPEKPGESRSPPVGRRESEELVPEESIPVAVAPARVSDSSGEVPEEPTISAATPDGVRKSGDELAEDSSAAQPVRSSESTGEAPGEDTQRTGSDLAGVEVPIAEVKKEPIKGTEIVEPPTDSSAVSEQKDEGISDAPFGTIEPAQVPAGLEQPITSQEAEGEPLGAPAETPAGPSGKVTTDPDEDEGIKDNVEEISDLPTEGISIEAEEGMDDKPEREVPIGVTTEAATEEVNLGEDLVNLERRSRELTKEEVAIMQMPDEAAGVTGQGQVKTPSGDWSECVSQRASEVVRAALCAACGQIHRDMPKPDSGERASSASICDDSLNVDETASNMTRRALEEACANTIPQVSSTASICDDSLNVDSVASEIAKRVLEHACADVTPKSDNSFNVDSVASDIVKQALEQARASQKSAEGDRDEGTGATWAECVSTKASGLVQEAICAACGEIHGPRQTGSQGGAADPCVMGENLDDFASNLASRAMDQALGASRPSGAKPHVRIVSGEHLRGTADLDPRPTTQSVNIRIPSSDSFGPSTAQILLAPRLLPTKSELVHDLTPSEFADMTYHFGPSSSTMTSMVRAKGKLDVHEGQTLVFPSLASTRVIPPTATQAPQGSSPNFRHPGDIYPSEVRTEVQAQLRVIRAEVDQLTRTLREAGVLPRADPPPDPPK